MFDTAHPWPSAAGLVPPEPMNVAELIRGDVPYASPHCQQWPWRPAPVPEGLPLKQAWGWLFVPDGRCLVLLDTEDWLPLLPGGTIEQNAGDLIFSRGSAQRPEHVGMFMGAGLVIEAPKTGKPVRITPLKDWAILAVRRVL